MSDIENIISGIIRRAGGNVKYAADSGGPAHFGISQHTLSNYLGWNASTAEIENLDQSLAHKIYRQNFYLAPGIDQLPAMVQGFVFDSAVNHGPE